MLKRSTGLFSHNHGRGGKWLRKHILEAPIFDFHDYGGKGEPFRIDLSPLSSFDVVQLHAIRIKQETRGNIICIACKTTICPIWHGQGWSKAQWLSGQMGVCSATITDLSNLFKEKNRFYYGPTTFQVLVVVHLCLMKLIFFFIKKSALSCHIPATSWGMRSLSCSFVLLVIAEAKVSLFPLTRRPVSSTRRLSEEARLYGDLTKLMAFHVDVLAPGEKPRVKH